MLSFIQKSLELKILLAFSVVIACLVGVSTYFDIRSMRTDTIRTSERTLGAFAAAIKGSVNAAMTKGHHEDVKYVLQEVNTPYFIDRVMIYNEEGKPLETVEKQHGNGRLDMTIPPEILRSVVNGDVTDIREQGDDHFIIYYAPIANQPQCFRCHGSKARLNGILRIDFSLHDLDDLVITRRNRVFLWSAVLFLLLTAVLLALLRIVVYRPVKELRDAMVIVQEGGDTLTLSTKGSDELADLKKSFLAMLHRINALHRTNIEKEKELARNQETMRFRAELQAMFDAMPDGVLLIDAAMTIVQANPRVYALLPDLDPAGGQIRPDCLKKECCPFQGVEDVLKRGNVLEHQCSINLSNGSTKHLHSICAPIVDNGRVVSVVEVIRDITERVRTERELEEKSAELVAVNKKLSQLAITDSLTQIFNRRRFNEILNKEIKRFSRRKYSALSLMMIDIDHFKKLNDTYGHLAGDTVLREIAKLLREGVRETDTVARFGGEEFVIVLPDTRLDGAAHKAEILVKRTEATEFPGHDTAIHVTISIGVAAYASGSPQDLIHAADLALYQAKRSGRNAVVVSRPEDVIG
jgi:diguanylate cyclase (GGDEF)-like protein